MADETVYWRYKALTQKLFSRMPGGERLNYLAQRYVTRSLALTDTYVQGAVRHASEYVRVLRQHGVRLTETTAFEFGAGWFLLKQLLLSLYGCKNQITVDLRRLATIKLINEALARLAECSQSLGTVWRPIRQISSFEDLHRQYGISYLAPSDARACGLPDRSVDLVSSTATLEHVPPEDIRAIMRESHRILRVRGLAVHYVDYTDHFAHVDKGISVYNFLQFSADEWKSYNSFIHYQNRLRHVEYVKLFAAAGFEVLEEKCDTAGSSELASLENLSISPAFAGFSLAQLSIPGAWFVLKPRHERPRADRP